jgi:hypothetical protein
MSDDMNPAAEEAEVHTDLEADVSDHDADQDSVLDRLIDGEDDSSVDAPQSEPPAAEEAPDGEWDSLHRVLRRDNVPQAVIDATDPETLRDWANRAQKRQGDVDEYGAKLKALESQLEQGGADEDASDDGDTQAEGSTDPLEGVNIPEALADIVGDEAAEAIVQMIHAGQQSTQQLAERAAAESRLVAQVMAADAVMRPTYGAAAPATDALIAEMNRLGTENQNSYASVDDMLAEAYRNLSGDPPKRKRSSRQPTPTRSQPPKQPKPPADTEDLALDLLMAGESRDAVARAMRT